MVAAGRSWRNIAITLIDLLGENPDGFENSLLACTRLAQSNPRLLKPLVQNSRDSAEKFENRLLGPTNQRQD
jgi:hypothetical protein